MRVPKPHFLLFSESRGPAEEGAGEWRFVLEDIEGDVRMEVEDEEPSVRGDRLDLLATVRGLEALDQPSRVTLVTNSRYVARGFRYGLPEWRENDWQWERFGQMAPIRNDDLWRRIDRALQYHQVDCRSLHPSWVSSAPSETDSADHRVATPRDGARTPTAEAGPDRGRGTRGPRAVARTAHAARPDAAVFGSSSRRRATSAARRSVGWLARLRAAASAVWGIPANVASGRSLDPMIQATES